MAAETVRTRWALALLVAAPVGVASAGQIGVDDFTQVEESWPVTVDTVTTVTITEFELSGFGALGAERITEIEMEAIEFGGVDEAEIGIFTEPGLLNYASSAGADGRFSLTYDAPGGGDLNADLSLQDRIRVEVLDYDDAQGTQMEVVLTLGEGGDLFSGSAFVTDPGDATLTFLFGALVGPGSLDLSSVDSISLDFQAPTGADFRVDDIVAIPEPVSLLLMVIGGALIRRR